MAFKYRVFNAAVEVLGHVPVLNFDSTWLLETLGRVCERLTLVSAIRLQGRIEGKSFKAVLANKILQTTCSVPRHLDER